MLEDPTDSGSEAIEELFEDDDAEVDPEVDDVGDPVLTPGDVDEGDDVWCIQLLLR